MNHNKLQGRQRGWVKLILFPLTSMTKGQPISFCAPMLFRLEHYKNYPAPMLLLSFSLRFLLFCTESSSLCVHFPQGNSKRQSIWRWARAKVIGVMSYKTDRERKWKEGKGRVAARSLTHSFTYSTHFVFARNEPSVFLLHPQTTHVGRLPLECPWTRLLSQ